MTISSPIEEQILTTDLNVPGTFFSHNYVSHIFLITLSLSIQPIDSNLFYPDQSLSFSIHIQNQVVYGNWGSGILWLVYLQYIM